MRRPLLSEHSGAFLHLQKLLAGKQGFTLCFLVFSDSAYRNKAAEHLANLLHARTQVTINPSEPIGTEELFKRLNAGEKSAPAQLLGIERWPEGLDDLLARLNHRRDAMAKRCRRPLLFWVLSKDLNMVATRAPDLWAWRSGVFDFSLPHCSVHVKKDNQSRIPFTSEVDAAKRRSRIRELRDYFAMRRPTHAYEINLLVEWGDLHFLLGDLEAAEGVYRQAKQALSGLDDSRQRAIVWGRIADILEIRGELDKALRIRIEEEMPVYERLGELRESAVTQGKVADVLYVRGEFDEALRIRVEEEMPVYERLGDVRLRAVAQGKVADILYAQGELDEALRIRVEEEIPTYDRLGNVRSSAIARGKVADVFQIRGELDEALRIRVEEQIPVFREIGDSRSLAITQGRIADILEARGEVDEALRIRFEEEMPIYEQLGDKHSYAITRGQIADILEARGQLDEALHIYETEVLPSLESIGNPAEVQPVRDQIGALRRQIQENELWAEQEQGLSGPSA